MLRALGLVLWLIASPAIAQWGGGANIVNVLNPQVIPANASAGIPAVDDNLAGGNYGLSQGVCAEWGHFIPCTQHYSITRASTKYCAASDNTWFQQLTGIICYTNQGVLIEEARTNTALWARDMTNAAWVKVTMTTALNAVGIDGTANSATTLTATGALASILQTLVIGSTAENYSVWLKRVTGSGAVNITINNLVGTTACTVTSTTAFTRCTVTATLANPVIGIQLATSGDVVIADFNQLEAGAFPTSPILTTTVTATRAGDAITTAGALDRALNSASGSVLFQMAASTNTVASFYLLDQNGSNANYLMALFSNTTVGTGTTAQPNVVATLGSGTFMANATKTATSWNAASGRSIVSNNGTVATDSNNYSPGTPTYIGSRNLSAGSGIFTYANKIVVWVLKLPDATLKPFTIP